MGNKRASYLVLRTEPRLRGVVVSRDSRNPPDWQGRAFAYEQLGSWKYVQTVLDGNGEPLRDGDRIVAFRTEESAMPRLASRAYTRRMRQQLDNGTLDTVVRCPPVSSRWAYVAVGVMLGSLCALLWWGLLREYFSTQPWQRDSVRLVVLVGLAGVPTVGSVLMLWSMARSERRSCNAFRLGAESITPLDGRHAGVEFRRERLVAHKRLTGLRSLMTFSDGALMLYWPLWLHNVWTRTEQQYLTRQNAAYKRSAWWLVIGGIVIVTSVMLLPADWKPGEQWWRPLCVLPLFMAMAAFIYATGCGWQGPAWLYTWSRRRSRTLRKRAADKRAQR